MVREFKTVVAVAMTTSALLGSTAWAAKKAAKPAAPAPAAAAAPAKPQACPTGAQADPQKHVAAMSERLSALAKAAVSPAALHAAISEELQSVVDWNEMARLTLPSQWDGLQPAQKAEFTALLNKMVINTYVKRFKAGTAVEVRDKGLKILGDGRTQVTTMVTVGKTSADVAYVMRRSEGCWRVSDIAVDEASQVQSYRQNFGKILTKEGWSGLIARMTKAANKKT